MEIQEQIPIKTENKAMSTEIKNMVNNQLVKTQENGGNGTQYHSRRFTHSFFINLQPYILPQPPVFSH